MKRKRLDEMLLIKNLVKDKDEAFVVVTEGHVFVDGQKAISPAQPVTEKSNIELRVPSPYVGRGAYKLEAALEKFSVEIRDTVCADIGAATGGFTEVLLLRGARKVYAIDTAFGKFALKLRNDPRVILMEKTDVRDIPQLPEQVDIVTIDVSLISLRDILPHVRRFLKADGKVIALFKPQYETRDQSILRHGIIHDDATREKLRDEFMEWLGENGWKIQNQIVSPIRGGEGNVEYLFLLC